MRCERGPILLTRVTDFGPTTTDGPFCPSPSPGVRGKLVSEGPRALSEFNSVPLTEYRIGLTCMLNRRGRGGGNGLKNMNKEQKQCGVFREHTNQLGALMFIKVTLDASTMCNSSLKWVIIYDKCIHIKKRKISVSSEINSPDMPENVPENIEDASDIIDDADHVRTASNEQTCQSEALPKK
ncbi:hypothetical protein HNY73_012852 [Argiope bruennichi]|uniref:Uncharacterized protein n=1 Tax=Argiope bruennichi TaxID=94029 RepID=A0A8T0EW77_ARGBR|nr:hypothetical protein HNY73_012852 [Argiope bruennichi]